MKIAVNGYIIDTKMIYQITPVSEKQEYVDEINEWGFAFYIYFFNQPLPFVVVPPKPIIHRDKVVELHDAIVEKWLEDQSDIPQLNFEY